MTKMTLTDLMQFKNHMPYRYAYSAGCFTTNIIPWYDRIWNARQLTSCLKLISKVPV